MSRKSGFRRVDACGVWMRASFTVEASMVIPFLCLLLAVVLQMILYLHDTSIFASAAYEAAQKGAGLKNCGQETREEYAKEVADELLQTKRLAFSSYEVEVNAAATKVQVCIKGSTDFLQGVSIEVEKEALCTNSVDYLRKVKKMKKLWEKIRGGFNNETGIQKRIGSQLPDIGGGTG